ncbi:MAG: hypothetical protein P8Y99_18930 [Calditrichaceae bacterium]
MKYLFYIAKAYSIPIVQPLVTYLEEQTADFRFYVSEKVRERKPEKWCHNKILTRLKDARQFKPDFVLCPGNFVDFRIPGMKVQLFHGLGVELSGEKHPERIKTARKQKNYFICTDV